MRPADVQTIIRWIFASEPPVCASVTLRGICGGKSDTKKGLSASPSVFLCQYHSTAAPYQLVYNMGNGQGFDRDPVPQRHSQPTAAITARREIALDAPQVVGFAHEPVVRAHIVRRMKYCLPDFSKWINLQDRVNVICRLKLSVRLCHIRKDYSLQP